MKNCLLVEPEYKTKYPNIALMKLSTKLKNEGYSVKYIKGIKQPSIDDWFVKYDEIYITSLFTYESEIVIDTINNYKTRFPKSKIFVGGILASLMPDLIEKKTGIKPFIGYSKELDKLKPDYDLIEKGSKWDDFSFIFTARGCVNNCPFCAVPRLEPDNWINPNWKQCIDLRRKNVMIHDNNLTSLPMEHFRDVCNFLKEHKLGVIFDNGFDCRLFNEDHLKALEGVRILPNGLRFAFDGMQEDEHIQRTLKLCFDNGISKGKITVFLLFNFNDTPKEAEYRMREVVKLGARVYPQMYIPLNKKSRAPIFVGKYWTKELAREFRKFYLLMGYYTKWTFPEWLEKEKKYHLLEQFNKYPMFPKKKKKKILSAQRIKQEGKLREYDEISPTIQTPSGGGHIPYVSEEVLAWSQSHRDYKDEPEERIKIGEFNTLSTGEGCRSQSSQNFVAKLEKPFALTERRTEKAKKIRREHMKKGKDWCPRREKKIVPRDDDNANCVTSGLTKEALVVTPKYSKIRRLTPIECERLQGFPDNFTKGVSDTQRYKQLGNAVTTNVIEAIGKKIIDVIDDDYEPERLKFGKPKGIDDYI